MAYSSVAQLRANQVSLDSDTIDDTAVDTRIVEADKKIRSDLKKVIDFSLITVDYTDSNFPEFLNILSQYKTAELSIVYAYGAKRSIEEETDRQYWAREYNDLKGEILNDETVLELTDGTSLAGGTQTYTRGATENIEPALGTGKWGAFQTDEELEQERPARQ